MKGCRSGQATLAFALLVYGTGLGLVYRDLTCYRLWREYRRGPGEHWQIPDVSRAGYRFGGDRLPRARVTMSVADFGATGDGTTPDTEAFRRALEEARVRGGGVIGIPEGTYLLEDVLRLEASNIVLRGEGAGRTVLHFSQSLGDLKGHSREWSWRGGLVWAEGRVADQVGEAGSTIAVQGNFPEGAARIRVDPEDVEAARNLVGRTVTFRTYADWSFIAKVFGHPSWREYNWEGFRPMARGVMPWDWPNEIVAVHGDGHVDLRKPLRLPVREAWRVEFGWRYGTTEGIGVEDLTIRFPEHVRRGHLNDPGYNGIFYHGVHHGWIRNVRIEEADNGIVLERSSHVTIRGVEMDGRSMHHASSFRYGSHDNLMEDFHIQCRRVHHGISSQDFASGNVWRRGRMESGTLDSHRGLPFDLVRTDLTLNLSGNPGGSGWAGPMVGRRAVNWNIRVVNEEPPRWAARFPVSSPDYFSRGALVGIRGVEIESPSRPPGIMPPGDKDTRVESGGRWAWPRDLYAAQRRTGG